MDARHFENRADRPIVIVGSLNMDLVMRTPRVPESGETLEGHGFSTVPGGKGANQAVACARLGGRVALVGKVGADAFGRTLCDGLIRDGVHVSHVAAHPEAGTGVAVILVEDSGQNRILLAAGANGTLDVADIEGARALIENAAMLILQLEVPMAAVERAVEIAHSAGVPVLLNPAPARQLPEGLLSRVSILVPNETEASLLSGMTVSDSASAQEAASRFLAQGVGSVLVTLGAQGVVVVDGAGGRHMPAQAVKAVDTTAAGDTFIGGLAVALAEGKSIDAAVALGQRASALCVTRPGAQPSIPYRHELDCRELP
jgi:ribokinase